MQVNEQNDDPISYYWYNTKGQRIAWQDDADADTTIDADEKYHIVLDMYGRTAATIRHEDTYNPGGGAVHAFKELFLYHMPGLGGSGYSDNILVRLRDNSNTWTGAGDGTLEEEIYYHANSRGEMVALTDASGRLVEQVRYTPEGRPFNLPAGDAESDGDLDATDASLITTGGYEIRKDADLDGDHDVDDVYYAGGIYGGAVTTGDGVLSYSGIGNRRAARGRDQDTASSELQFRGGLITDTTLTLPISNIFSIFGPTPVPATSPWPKPEPEPKPEHENPWRVDPLPPTDFTIPEKRIGHCKGMVSNFIVDHYWPRLTLRPSVDDPNIWVWDFEEPFDPCVEVAKKAGHECCDQDIEDYLEATECIEEAARAWAICKGYMQAPEEPDPPPAEVQLPEGLPPSILVNPKTKLRYDCFEVCAEIERLYGKICASIPGKLGADCARANRLANVACIGCCSSVQTTAYQDWANCVQDYADVMQPLLLGSAKLNSRVVAPAGCGN